MPKCREIIFILMFGMKKNCVNGNWYCCQNENLYSFLGGTLSDYFAYRPNDFLKYSIIKWGIENHYKRFILGGGHGTEDGIFKYKKSFAPHDGCTPFYVGKRIINESIYNNLSDSKNKSDFFPLYRSNQT